MRTLCQPFKLTSAALLIAAILPASAQTTANFIGPASGGEWNTSANWDTAAPPLDTTTNAFIGAGTNVNYNLPMKAASFGTLTLNGVLNVNTNGFNNTGMTMLRPAGGNKLFVNTNGNVAVTGNMTVSSNAAVTINNGGALTVSGTFQLGGGTVGAFGFVTNAGIFSAPTTQLNPNNNSLSTGCLFVINGGSNYLGNYSMLRMVGSAGALGTEGLLIYNGLCNFASIGLGVKGASLANSFLTMLIAGGTVTNTGTLTLQQQTTARYSRFVQTGGLFVMPDPALVYVSTVAVTNSINIYSVTGGTNIVGGFFFGGSNAVAGVGANPSTLVNFTNSSAIYVGSVGIASNGICNLTAALNAGGLFGATADWTGSANMKLTGGNFTFQTADQGGTAHNITLSGGLSGNGTLVKTGGGTLNLNGANTYSGSTFINSSTLALGANGTLASTLILVGAGNTFDVSAQSGNFSPTFSSQTLSGFGMVNGLVTATNGTIQAGSNTLTGTLTFGGGLSESGGVVNKFILSSNPNGPNNDLISVTGNLTLSGLNTVSVSGSLPNGANYTLFQYSGSLGGSVANLTLTGATGYLTNIANTIVLHTLATTRGPTNITWVGNSVNNYWDTSVTTNWVNTGVLDYFIASDNVIFSNTGGNNPFVSIVGSVTPNSAVVNTASNYVFAGTGSIDGSASLTVSNGSLTILTTNNYTGPTTLAGGIIATPLIANSLTASGIGAASTDPANLVFNGGTLFYFGGNFVTDHGVTFTNAGGTIDVTNGTTLTLGGVIVGNGVLSKTDTGSLTLNMANTYSGGTVVSNGTLTLNNASSAGTGTINLYGGNLALGAVKPANTINVAGNAEVTGANSSGNTGIKNVTGNSNLLLNVSGGTTFDLTGDMGAYSGTITLSNGGGAFVRLNGSIGSPLATWNLGTSPMDLNVRSGSTSNNLGALTGVAGTTLTGRTGSGNTGSTTYYIGANNMNSTFYGVIQNGGANANSVTKVGSGTLTLAGQNTYTGGTTVSSGTLALTNLSGTDGSIADSATINLQSGAFIDVTGLIAPALQLSSSTAQLLEGSGTVRGQINVGAASTIAPGGGLNGALGTLTATNTIALNGTAWMKLDRSASPNSDHLVVSSSSAGINYGGTLTVTNAGGTLQSGDNFTIFSAAGGLAGSFSATNLPALNSGLAWNFNPTAGTLTVVSGVNTTPTNITATVSGNTLTLSWPVDHTGWHLQAQTNSLGSGLGINWITIPGTDASNTYNVTLNPANPTVFYRMVYP